MKKNQEYQRADECLASLAAAIEVACRELGEVYAAGAPPLVAGKVGLQKLIEELIGVAVARSGQLR